jgi:hypothetical protein
MTVWLACKNQDTAAVQNVETCRQKIIFKNQVESLLLRKLLRNFWMLFPPSYLKETQQLRIESVLLS